MKKKAIIEITEEFDEPLYDSQHHNEIIHSTREEAEEAFKREMYCANHKFIRRNLEAYKIILEETKKENDTLNAKFYEWAINYMKKLLKN